MIFYFSGNVIGQDQVMYDTGIRSKLLTFAEVDDWGKDSFEYWLYHKPADARIFLDSGAFSAFMRGAVIDLDRYTNFCQQHQDRLDTFVQLDRIGDPLVTRQNLGIMERGGLRPIPVYTALAPVRDLEALCEKYRHIALGGNFGSRDVLRRNFDKIFRVAERYWPIKFHAFAVTAQWALERYPFYSVDSSSAIVGAGMGRVMSFTNGKITSEPWREYARRTYNGRVVDGIGDTGTTSTVSAHMGRRKHNVEAILAFERYINKLWQAKGVSWPAS
jgi:hypothetical protein